MIKSLTIKIIIIVMLISGNLCSKLTHTIYVSGPPVGNNTSWFKESKLLYNGLKKEICKSGNSVELFPKKIYRSSIIKNKKYKSSRGFKKLSLSKNELITSYKSNELLGELITLVLKRRDEISDINSNKNTLNKWDIKIHLKAHGIGGRLLTELKDSKYKNSLGTLIVFDGEQLKEELCSELSTSDISSSESSSEITYNGLPDLFKNVTELNKEILSIYLKRAKKLNISEESIIKLVKKYQEQNNNKGNTIINITINEIVKMADEDITNSKCHGCSAKKFFGTTGAIIALVGSILALL